MLPGLLALNAEFPFSEKNVLYNGRQAKLTLYEFYTQKHI